MSWKVILYSPKSDDILLISKDAYKDQYNILSDMDLAYDIQKHSLNGGNVHSFDDFVFIAIEEGL